MNPVEALLVALAGVAAGAINTLVGSGTLITFPTLLAFGVPPVTANVSNTIGLVPGSVAGALGYRRELAGQRPRVMFLASASLIGGLAGALLLCSVIAPSLRPRLGAVGGLLAVTVALLATALAGARDAARGPEVAWTVPGMGLLVLALVSAGVTVLAWRWTPGPRTAR